MYLTLITYNFKLLICLKKNPDHDRLSFRLDSFNWSVKQETSAKWEANFGFEKIAKMCCPVLICYVCLQLSLFAFSWILTIWVPCSVCCLGLAGEKMIVLVLIVVIRIMTSGTMGITSRHRQADTKSQILEKADLGKKERTLSKRIFVSKLIKYTASHLHPEPYLSIRS